LQTNVLSSPVFAISNAHADQAVLQVNVMPAKIFAGGNPSWIAFSDAISSGFMPTEQYLRALIAPGFACAQLV